MVISRVAPSFVSPSLSAAMGDVRNVPLRNCHAPPFVVKAPFQRDDLAAIFTEREEEGGPCFARTVGRCIKSGGGIPLFPGGVGRRRLEPRPDSSLGHAAAVSLRIRLGFHTTSPKYALQTNCIDT